MKRLQLYNNRSIDYLLTVIRKLLQSVAQRYPLARKRYIFYKSIFGRVPMGVPAMPTVFTLLMYDRDSASDTWLLQL